MSMTSREKLSSDCAESDSNIIKYVFKDYKLSEIARNIYSYIIKGLSHWNRWILSRAGISKDASLRANRWILSLVGISTDARKLASFDIPIRDKIHRYQCNNPNLHVGLKVINHIPDREALFRLAWIVIGYSYELCNLSVWDHLSS